MEFEGRLRMFVHDKLGLIQGKNKNYAQEYSSSKNNIYLLKTIAHSHYGLPMKQDPLHFNFSIIFYFVVSNHIYCAILFKNLSDITIYTIKFIKSNLYHKMRRTSTLSPSSKHLYFRSLIFVQHDQVVYWVQMLLFKL